MFRPIQLYNTTFQLTSIKISFTPVEVVLETSFSAIQKNLRYTFCKKLEKVSILFFLKYNIFIFWFRFFDFNCCRFKKFPQCIVVSSHHKCIIKLKNEKLKNVLYYCGRKFLCYLDQFLPIFLRRTMTMTLKI